MPQTGIPLLEDLPFFGEVLFDHNVVVYASFALIVLSYFWIYHSRPGLDLRAVGERPEAAFARGIPVNRMRYLYVALGGALVGVAGATFSLDVKLGWSEGHTTNFGWIALAIVIFGGWHPLRVALGCYLFGLLQIMAVKLQPELPNLSQVLPIMPFPLMIAMLVLVNRPFIRRLSERWPLLRGLVIAEPPSALGSAFRRE